MVLSRILAPDAFGLMLLTMVFLQGFQMLSDIGIAPSIVKSHRSNESIFRNSAWTLQVIRGVLIALLTIACAYPVASIYGEPELAPLISFIALSAIIDGVCPTSRHMAARNLNYLRISMIELSSQLITMIITIVLAIQLQSVWALAIGALSGITLKTLGVYLFLPDSSNWFALERNAVRELISYGKWIFFSTALTFLAQHGDKLILGTFLSKSDLGAYAIALFMIEGVAGLVSRLMGQIVFPILSKFAREEKDKIRGGYYKARRKLELLTMPLAGILITCGDLIVDILYDDRYQLAGTMLQILGIRLTLTIITAPGTKLLMATEKVHWLPIIQSTGLFTMLILIMIFHHFWGTIGVVWGASLSYLIYVPMTLFALKGSDVVSIRKELFFLLPLSASLLVGYAISELLGVAF